jgi:TRAP-type C4-dicarboxylate transport system permease small subunit
MSAPGDRIPGLHAKLVIAHVSLRHVSRVFAIAAASCLLVMMLAGVLDVVTSQTFLRPVYQAYEIAVVFLVLVVWLSVPLVEQEGEQITSTFLYSRMGEGKRGAIDFVSALAATGVTGILALVATQRLFRSFAMDERLPLGQYVPLAPIRLGFALGIYLLTIVCLVKLVLVILERNHGVSESRAAGKGRLHGT